MAGQPNRDGGGGGRGGGGGGPALTLSPRSPFALGNVSSTTPTDFIVLASGGPLNITGINFSDPVEWSCTDTFPIAVTTSTQIHLRVTPNGTGPRSVTLTFNNTGDQAQVSYVINATAIDPATQGIIQVTPEDPSLPLGQALTTKSGSTTLFGIGLQNVGAVAFHITNLQITSGAPQFLFPSGSAVGWGVLWGLGWGAGLPLTLNPGDPPIFIEIEFAPDDVGIFNGNLEITTDLVAPQNKVEVALSGLSIPFIPVSVLSNVNRTILFGFDSGSNKFLEINTFNYAEQDSVLECNGTLWNNPGMEKTIERMEVYYENVGVCTGLSLTLTVLRPSQGPDAFDVVSKTVTIGTAAADGTDRSQYFDLTASGEIIFLTVTRIKNTGPCILTAFIPHFADRGEKVENV